MTGTEIYKRTSSYERDAKSIRLHAPQWKLLLAYDGQRSLAEVALSAEVEFAVALPLTEKFLARGWIEEQPITLEQYLKRTGAADLSAIGAAVPPAVILHAPKSEVVEPTPAAPEPSAPSSATSVVSPTIPAQSRRGAMRLGAVVDFIIKLAENVALGQLMVYRVFLRVPHELLQAEDIVSVYLVNDTSVVRSDALQEAIAGAVLEIVKQPLPDEVFAPA